jgi:hypothetical protein
VNFFRTGCVQLLEILHSAGLLAAQANKFISIKLFIGEDHE